MAQRTKWTAEQRDAALDIYTHSGPRAASRATGIPPTTISRWAKEAGIAGQTADKTRDAVEGRKRVWAEYKADTLQRLGPAALNALDRIQGCSQDEGANARQWAVTLGVLIDKAQLLSGGATERVDWSALPAEERAARLTAARDDLAQVVDLQSRKVVGQ